MSEADIEQMAIVVLPIWMLWVIVGAITIESITNIVLIYQKRKLLKKENPNDQQ